MTPKEKAEELVEKMKITDTLFVKNYKAKQCALICVDEILEVSNFHSSNDFEFWQEVKNELEKL